MKTLRLHGETEENEVLAEFMVTTPKVETIEQEQAREKMKEPVPLVTCRIVVVR